MNAKPLVVCLIVLWCCSLSRAQSPTSTQAMINQQWSRGRAEGKGPVKLQSFPLRLADIGTIIPMGNMQSGHTTPSDHLYLVPKGATNQFRGNMQGRLYRSRELTGYGSDKMGHYLEK